MSSSADLHEYIRLIGQFPRFQAEVFPPSGADIGDLAWEPSEETVRSRINAGRKLFPMPEAKDDTRFQAQLWWWSMCGAIVGPSMAAIVSDNVAPVLDWAEWKTFARDEYWLGFQAQAFQELARDNVEQLHDYGRELADFLSPIADLVSEVGSIKPAPLWAVAADAVANAAVAVGNELMDPWAGCVVGYCIVEGMREGHSVPLPRYVDVVDGRVSDWDLEAALAGEEPDIDVTSHLERTTCCMIYHSPDADLCVSCPKHPREVRHRQWIAMSEW